MQLLFGLMEIGISYGCRSLDSWKGKVVAAPNQAQSLDSCTVSHIAGAKCQPVQLPLLSVLGSEEGDYMPEENVVYAGFWIRVWAAMVDSILILLLSFPLLIWVYGWAYFDLENTALVAGPADFVITWILPAIAVVVFWITRQATPGKMIISAKVVDATSGNALSTGQCIGRYLAYFVASIPLGLGIIWVAFDKRKQGWHDKLAGTVVVRHRTNKSSHEV